MLSFFWSLRVALFGSRRLLPLSGRLWLILFIPSAVHAQVDVGVDIRIVNEVAPAGGLAVVLVELTEPKPISGGRLRLDFGESLLGPVTGVVLFGSVEFRNGLVSFCGFGLVKRECYVDFRKGCICDICC